MRRDSKTVGYEEDQVWAPPVETRAALPADAPTGQLCFVQDENRTYQRRPGRWEPVGRRED